MLLRVRQVEGPKEDLKEKVKDVKALWIFVDQGLDLCRFCSTGKTAAEAAEPSPEAAEAVEAGEAAESDAEAEPQRRRPGRVSTWDAIDLFSYVLSWRWT